MNELRFPGGLFILIKFSSIHISLPIFPIGGLNKPFYLWFTFDLFEEKFSAKTSIINLAFPHKFLLIVEQFNTVLLPLFQEIQIGFRIFTRDIQIIMDVVGVVAVGISIVLSFDMGICAHILHTLLEHIQHHLLKLLITLQRLGLIIRLMLQ
jgi:hypothetical protein